MFLLALVFATPLAAQSAFVKPEVLDSSTARLRDSYIILRDTLHSVSGASAILQRDVRTSSDAVLLSRARRVEASCTGALRHLDGTREEMLNSALGKTAAQPRRTAMDKSFLDLRAALVACSSEFKTMSSRENVSLVRSRGVNQAGKNQVAVRNFERAGESYLMSLGIKVRPFGAGANPLAGSTRPNQ